MGTVPTEDLAPFRGSVRLSLSLWHHGQNSSWAGSWVASAGFPMQVLSGAWAWERLLRLTLCSPSPGLSPCLSSSCPFPAAGPILYHYTPKLTFP